MTARVLIPRPAPTRRAAPTFDWRIGVPVLIAVALQTAGALLWIGAAEQRLAQVERRSAGIALLIERTARLEEQMAAGRASRARIEAKLDRLVEARTPAFEQERHP